MTRARNSLELDVILKNVASFASTALAQEAISQMQISTDLTEVNEMLSATSEAVRAITEFKFSGISRFEPIADALGKAGARGILTMRELLDIAGMLSSARVARKTLISYPDVVSRLVDMGGRMYSNDNLCTEITDKILSENEISDNASYELKNIRTKIKSAKNRLHDKLNSFTKSSNYSKFLQDNLYTIRNGRYVLPVKNECRQDIKGLLHDQSASGATAFIEPFEVVELNNETIKLIGDEAREIERILRDLSDKVAADREMLSLCQEQLTQLDILTAKARYSVHIDGIVPRVNYAEKVLLKGARHPLIDKNKVVSIDISLGDGANILLISGPNTGGKTASLKTVGLFSLMMCVGLLLPCREGSEMAIFDNIFCDIGDAQDLRQSLSTFSSHILNIKNITESFTDYSLILLDEIGSSTDPREGSALAVGVLEFIASTKAKAIITTHYPGLKDYAMLNSNIRNAAMQFDEVSLSPTFKLLLGYPGSSNALETAEKLGFSRQILSIARRQLGTEQSIDYERLLKEAAQLKSEAENERAKAITLRREYEDRLGGISVKEARLTDALGRINQNAKTETRRLVVSAMEQVNELIDEVKAKLKEENESSVFAARKILKQIDDISYENSENIESVTSEPISADEIRAGAEVVIKKFGVIGKIKACRDSKNEAEVLVNGKTIRVEYSGLAKPEARTLKNKAAPKITLTAATAARDRTQEIMLIGKTVDEALVKIDEFLSSPEAMTVATLRLVHGKGSGALGRGIQQYLKSLKLIKSFRYGGYGEGDMGVTIASLI